MMKHEYLARLASRANSNQTFAAKNCEVLIVDKKEDTVVVFRGVDVENSIGMLKDLVSNLLAFPIDTKECGKVHYGTYKAAKTVFKELQQYITKDQNLVLAGHSFGGAIAVLLSKMLSSNGYNVTECVTFGSPKVVNQKDIGLYSGIVQYIVNGDIVPEFPGKFWKYSHIFVNYLGPKAEKLSRDKHDIDEYIAMLS